MKNIIKEKCEKDILEFSKYFLWNFKSHPHQKDFIKKIKTNKNFIMRWSIFWKKIYPTFKWKKIKLWYEKLNKKDNWLKADFIIIDEIS